VDIVDLDERPDLCAGAVGLGCAGGEFLRRGIGASVANPRRYLRSWPTYFLVALEDGVPVARALAVPVAFPADGRAELPADGRDAAIQWAVRDLLDDRPPTALCTLEIVVAPDRRRSGLATGMVKAVIARAVRAGFARVVVPARPVGKEAEPNVPMAEYAARRRPDGLPADPWLRTHERLGATQVGVCPSSVTVTGSLAEWQAWTGVRLADGANRVPGGIAPVHASVRHDRGTYCEANVWLEHTI
jgi:GNAT superfamily N-acetyltransferase